jgi:hypothetical protein
MPQQQQQQQQQPHQIMDIGPPFWDAVWAVFNVEQHRLQSRHHDDDGDGDEGDDPIDLRHLREIQVLEAAVRAIDRDTTPLLMRAASVPHEIAWVLYLAPRVLDGCVKVVVVDGDPPNASSVMFANVDALFVGTLELCRLANAHAHYGALQACIQAILKTVQTDEVSKDLADHMCSAVHCTPGE